MRSPAHCTPCNAFVGATLAVARPLHLLLRFRRGRRPRRPDRLFPHLRQGTRALPYKALRYRGRADRGVRPYKPFRRAGCPHPAAGLAPHSLQKPCHCEPVTDSLVWQSVPPSLASLPKGGWHGEAVTGGFFSCVPCCAFVGATLAVARPLHLLLRFRRGRRPRRPDKFFPHLRQGTRALPYKVLRYRGRADRVVRPYKPFRRAGCPHPTAGLVPHSLTKTLSLVWQSVLRPRKYFSLHAKKGPRHPAEPLFKPIQFIRNPHCPPCAGAAPHPGCCSLP